MEFCQPLILLIYVQYKDFYTNTLAETFHTDSFSDLPERPPYGFLVYPDGSFGIVDEWGGHEKLVKGKDRFEDENGDDGVARTLRKGGIRIGKTVDYGYHADYFPRTVTQKAKKTAKDLAALYKTPIEFGGATWLKESLEEAYPVTFNLAEFNKVPSFAGKYRYAEARLPKIASGSGRTVFKVDETKVLKIAKNKKGLAQNNVESERYLQNYDLVARVFDTDDHDFWVEMELAKKVGKSRFEQLTGISIDDLQSYLRFRSYGSPRTSWSTLWTPLEDVENNEFVADLTSLQADYSFPDVGDFGRLSTYGEVVREGKPKIVLVDFGLTQSVWDDYYRVKL